MATITYTTSLFGDIHTMTADFAQASSNIAHNGMATQYQVADFSHDSDAAFRQLLEAEIEASGDDIEDEDIAAELDDAIDSIVEK